MTRARRSAAVALTAAMGLALAAPARASVVTVSSGSSLGLGGGSLGLGCGDLVVDGTLSFGTGGLEQARDVTITGVVNGNSATLEVAGDWNNAGTFNAGTSTLQMVDGCGLTSAVVTGDTTFANLAITTTSGKRYSFAAGSTQTVTGLLTLLGALGNLLEIDSTVGGSVAFLELVGTGSAHFVQVSDNDVSAGNPITLGPDSVRGPNTPGWLEAPMMVPGLSLLALAVLVGVVQLVGRRVLRMRA